MTFTLVGHTAAPSSPTPEIMSARCYAKSVSLTAGEVLTAIQVYKHYDTPGDTHAWTAFILTDNAGVPGRIFGAGSAKNEVTTTSLGTDGSDRWMTIPMGVIIDSSTTYWLGVRACILGGTSGDVSINYEGSGSDYRWVGAGFASDYDLDVASSKTNTGNDYMIRGVMLS